MQEHDIELPACFYLGCEYDLDNRTLACDRPPVMLDARDLRTHGVLVGMTGSGKTGLGISILEEAAIDGIPSIILDVKGDLTNLLLQFPDLQPGDFLPWLNPEDARIEQLSDQAYAEKLANRWRQGLAETLQGPERIARLRAAAEWVIYTPGSDAGLPLSVLKTFAAPSADLSRELLNQRIEATATALLGLTGVSGDPVQSREHILIAQLLLHAWSRQEDLDLPRLIQRIQQPPIHQVGAFDMETFFPESERLSLALSLNNILASPSFSTWIEGDPLALEQMLYAPGDGELPGRPRQLIFYLAHLDDAQRMFFLTLLLEEVLAWSRKQSGTSNLRALLYFDEVFGYLPPYPRNPPTKLPLMTLMKQARAFGLGVLLATQNPVDLDYKALSNAGVWLIGKLQTDRDKLRLLEGLEGVAAERGTLTDRATLDRVISGLGKRVFLFHNVHTAKPRLFQTRWALSFLRGPLGRTEVARLMEPYKQHRASRQGLDPPPTVAEPDWTQARAADLQYRDQLRRSDAARLPPTRSTPPNDPAGVNPPYLPIRAWHPEQSEASNSRGQETPIRKMLVYHARLFGFAEVSFVDRKRNLQYRRPYRFLAEPPRPYQNVVWEQDESLNPEEWTTPVSGAEWSELPSGWDTPRKLKPLKKELSDMLYHHARLSLVENVTLGLTSEPGEDVHSFLARAQQRAVERADAERSPIQARYQSRLEQERRLLPPRPVPPPAVPRTFLDLVTFGLLRPPPPPPVPDPKRSQAERRIAAQEQKIQAIEAEWQARQADICDRWQQQAQTYTELLLKPRRDDIQVTHYGLIWAPYWHCIYADGRAERYTAYGNLRKFTG